MMLQRNFGRILNLLRRAAQNRSKTPCSHRRSRSNLGLTATLGPRNRGIKLDQTANSRSCQQKIGHLRNRGPRNVVQIITDRRRHHASRTIRRRSHHLTARRILFIHRHRIGRHIVVNCVWCGQVNAALRHERIINSLGPAAHKQPTGQNPIGDKAAIDASIHHFPNAG